MRGPAAAPPGSFAPQAPGATEQDIVGEAQNAEALRSQPAVANRVVPDLIRFVVWRPVEFDDEPRLQPCELDDIGSEVI
jgi:hypothetical protein